MLSIVFLALSLILVSFCLNLILLLKSICLAGDVIFHKKKIINFIKQKWLPRTANTKSKVNNTKLTFRFWLNMFLIEQNELILVVYAILSEQTIKPFLALEQCVHHHHLPLILDLYSGERWPQNQICRALPSWVSALQIQFWCNLSPIFESALTTYP